jgi:acetyl-CoA carboxylase carboxyltransferase component
VRAVLDTLFDTDSVLELSAAYGRCIVTAFARVEGRPVGVIANDCEFLGGAIDSAVIPFINRF